MSPQRQIDVEMMMDIECGEAERLDFAEPSRDSSNTNQRSSKMKRDSIKRVTIGLRRHDVENLNRFAELSGARDGANAFSLALSLATYFAEAFYRGEDILIRGKNKEVERVTIPYLKRQD